MYIRHKRPGHRLAAITHAINRMRARHNIDWTIDDVVRISRRIEERDENAYRLVAKIGGEQILILLRVGERWYPACYNYYLKVLVSVLPFADERFRHIDFETGAERVFDGQPPPWLCSRARKRWYKLNTPRVRVILDFDDADPVELTDDANRESALSEGDGACLSDVA